MAKKKSPIAKEEILEELITELSHRLGMVADRLEKKKIARRITALSHELSESMIQGASAGRKRK